MKLSKKLMQLYQTELAKSLVQRGLLLEAGFQVIEEQLKKEGRGIQIRNDSKLMFYLGADHVYSVIMNILDPGEEPTDKDLEMMDHITRELETIRPQLAARFNMKDYS